MLGLVRFAENRQYTPTDKKSLQSDEQAYHAIASVSIVCLNKKGLDIRKTVVPLLRRCSAARERLLSDEVLRKSNHVIGNHGRAAVDVSPFDHIRLKAQ